ncbi:uncharacterized protein LOC126372673 [Pectinophora gossypiella]|uniref:uncharacterized protein LOC126372673 n=1 Tax=Pectinophora gossypiella TaxID=13191 RepID=UPI00214E6168|nr:uncharacterized protein LOC126372673 [Pectinophora gossypiella]
MGAEEVERVVTAATTPTVDMAAGEGDLVTETKEATAMGTVVGMEVEVVTVVEVTAAAAAVVEAAAAAVEEEAVDMGAVTAAAMGVVVRVDGALAEAAAAAAEVVHTAIRANPGFFKTVMI